jgi:probable F420-dependent oxidoreductase
LADDPDTRFVEDTMKIGVALPQSDIGTDAVVLRDFAQAAEGIGYDHLAVYDHVVGINPSSRPDWTGAYTSAHAFHDPFALFGFLAGQTSRITLATHILILPQRQTVLVARQAASVDVLSNGRLRLGVGLGWNPVEFVTLGEDFSNRGRRSQEQIKVLQALWTQRHVKLSGHWHELPDVGLNPLPNQRPIPVWLGGHHENVLQRIAEIGDGWIILALRPDEKAAEAIGRLRHLVRGAGRSEASVGIDAWVSMGSAAPSEWREEISQWRRLGISHVTLNTCFDRLHHKPISGKSLADHLSAIRRYHEATVDLL